MSWLDPNALPSLVHLMVQVVSLNTDMGIIECTPRLPLTQVRSLLPPHYVLRDACFCLTDQGIPVRRRRMYGVYHSQRTMVEQYIEYGLDTFSSIAFKKWSAAVTSSSGLG